MKLRSNFISRLRYEGNGYWTKREYKYNETAKDYPVQMDKIPDCSNFHLQYPGCIKGQDNIFQEIHVNITQGGKKMPLFQPTGRQTHHHARFGLAWCAVAEAIVIFGWQTTGEISNLSAALFSALILALANAIACFGTIRWAIKKLADK